MVNWYNYILDKEWDVKPAGGLTGDAFFAKKGDEQVFLKRNSSPFLAVLSAENIVPKLIWTKRMQNGDVITAQKWLNGRKLKHEEMKGKKVLDILHKIHHSSELLHMLMRLGKKPNTTEANFNDLKKKVSKFYIHEEWEVKKSLQFLYQLLPSTKNQEHVVCHSDLNHNNFLLTNDDHLYLIDWDHAMIGDPVKDFGPILYWYIRYEEWDQWLNKYGIEKNKQLLERIYWYLLYDALGYLIWHYERNEQEKVSEWKKNVKKINDQMMTTILV